MMALAIINSPWEIMVLEDKDGKSEFRRNTMNHLNRVLVVNAAWLLLLLMSMASAYALGPYTDNGDTVMDTATGLEWQKAGDSTTRNWENALAYCEGLTLGRHDDWRLPDLRELDSIVDLNRYTPAIDLFFSCQSSFYWSATTNANLTSNAWRLNFNNGNVSVYNKSNSYYARCVRASFFNWILFYPAILSKKP